MTHASTGPGGGRLYTGFLTIACLALAVLVVLLALQNRSLKHARAEMEGRLAVAEMSRDVALLQQGDTLQPLELRDAEGRPGWLVFDGGGAPGTLLLVFSTDCPACQETFPLWNDLLAAGATPALDVVGLRLDADPSRPVPDGLLAFDAYDPADIAAFPTERILLPATLVLDAHGIVERSWYGVPSAGQLGEMSRRLFP